MTKMVSRIVYFGIRWIVGLVFIYAAVGKILDPTGFAEDIDSYRILPYMLVSLTAATLPWLELFCGLSLIIGMWIRGSVLLLTGMLTVFIIALVSAIARGLDITCGCFSIQGEGARVGIARIVEDVLLLAGTIWIGVKATKSISSQ